jgi:hypothetical protein
MTENPLENVDVRNAPLPVRYAEAKIALAECYKVDECKDWSDKMAALKSYARQAKNIDLERRLIEIRLRAERKAGEILKATEKAKGSPGNQHTGPVASADQSKTLAEIGVSKDQSSKWQQLADIPEEYFEAMVESDDPPSVTALADAGKNSREAWMDDMPEHAAYYGKIRYAVGAMAERIDGFDLPLDDAVTGCVRMYLQRDLDDIKKCIEWLTEYETALIKFGDDNELTP